MRKNLYKHKRLNRKIILTKDEFNDMDKKTKDEYQEIGYFYDGDDTLYLK